VTDASTPGWTPDDTGASNPGHDDAVRRVNIILEQIDTLPTLSTVASRLLAISSNDDADVREIIELVQADPSLTTKLLKLCRCAQGGLGRNVTTVDRAVVMLGLDAVRSAVLSVQVYETLNQIACDEATDGPRAFDRQGFWRHSLATAIASQLIAAAHANEPCAPDLPRPKPDEAYLAGLLHDLGKLALDVILPKSFNRVVSLAERHQLCMAEVERRIIGIDHHTAGKRLGEHWRLPHALQDVMWLHGQPFEGLPDLPHRSLIALVTIADLVVRRQHLGFSGNRMRGEELEPMCRECGLNPELVNGVVATLHERTAEQAAAIGLDDDPSDALFLKSIARANEALGRLNTLLEDRSRQSLQQSRVIAAISDFNAAAAPGRSILSAMGDVTRSAAQLFGDGLYLMLYQARGGSPWQIYQFAPDGRMVRSHEAPAPPGCADLDDLTGDGQVSMRSAAVLPWLTDYLGDAVDIRDVQLLPLCCSWGVTGVLVHDRDPAAQGMAAALVGAMAATWASAIAAAAQHAGARSLGEQLVEANRALAETQHKLTEARASARLGELAKGAAHEMNNPLTIISGRSQLLASRLTDERDRDAAEAIADQAHRLSNLITALHLFAEQPKPKRQSTDLPLLLEDLLSNLRRQFPDVELSCEVPNYLSDVWVDPAQLSEVLFELLQNALEAGKVTIVTVAVQADPVDGRLIIEVKDNGAGMDEHCL
jgi:HD-like signal output (HDOD) protein/signal transduction histidine kinase